jgi:hypothetical protein
MKLFGCEYMHKKHFKIIIEYALIFIGWLFLGIFWAKEIFNISKFSINLNFFCFWAAWVLLVFVVFFMLKKFSR